MFVHVHIVNRLKYQGHVRNQTCSGFGLRLGEASSRLHRITKGWCNKLRTLYLAQSFFFFTDFLCSFCL